MSAWQQIETAPRDGTKVLVWIGGRYGAMNAWNQGGRWYTSLGEFCVTPTHWMPMLSPPPPPKPQPEQNPNVDSMDVMDAIRFVRRWMGGAA